MTSANAKGAEGPSNSYLKLKIPLYFARSAALVVRQVFEIPPNFELIEQNAPLDKS